MRTEHRISIGITLVAAIALATALALIYVYENQFQEHRFDVALIAAARQQAHEAPCNLFSFTHASPGPDDVEPLDKYAVIYDRSGAVVAATAPFDAGAPRLREPQFASRRPFDLEYRGQWLRGVVMPIPGDHGHSLLLAASRQELDGDDMFLARAMVLAFVASMLCLFVSARWLTLRFSREQRRIAAALRKLAQGDLYARVPSGSADPDIEQWGHDLNEVAERLSQVIRSQQRFVANAAHELRTPLAALHGELQQSLRKERDAADYKRSTANALQAARRLKRLAEDLLTLARSEHARDERHHFRLREVFDDLLLEVGAQARAKDLELSLEAGDAHMLGRARDIQRLLRNLVDNAIRHSPRGAAIRVRACMQDQHVVMRVSDEGPGVPVEQRERIFEPFFRSAETRGSAREGCGLGLNIAREIARAHGGDLRLEHSARGAVFAVELASGATPRALPEGPGAAAPVPSN